LGGCPKAMWPAVRLLRIAAGLGALIPLIAACSSGLGTINVVPKPGDLLRPDWTSFSGHKEEFDLRPPGPQDLVSPDGYCQGASQPVAGAPGLSPEQAVVPGGIALQMTECDVVRRAGTPERTEVGTTNGGERAVVLTYTRGPRPGTYRFARGRLYSIERVPQQEAPARQNAAPAKKRA
jgi:hypothetical protein